MLALQRHLFTLDEDVHYLNCAYMSPVSKQVEAAGREGIAQKRTPSSIQPDDFFETADAIRARFGRLVHAPANSIAIIPAVSYGIATVAKNTRLEKGDNVIVVSEQFPSNIYSWKRRVTEQGAELRIIEPPDVLKQRGQLWNARILEAIDERTRVVSMAPVHWADGTLFDLPAIGERAREVDAALIVDGTQSVGALPFDCRHIQPDALICAAYKWLLAPYGIGVAYFGPRYADAIPIEEAWINRKGSEQFGGLVEYQDRYQAGAVRFDMGGRSNFIMLPMLYTALGHLEDWGVEAIASYCVHLTAPFLDEMKDLGYWMEESAWRASHLFGVRVRGGTAMERLVNAIQDANIYVSVRGNAVRISPHVYNDSRDMAALLEVLTSFSRSGLTVS